MGRHNKNVDPSTAEGARVLLRALANGQSAGYADIRRLLTPVRSLYRKDVWQRVREYMQADVRGWLSAGPPFRLTPAGMAAASSLAHERPRLEPARTPAQEAVAAVDDANLRKELTMLVKALNAVDAALREAGIEVGQHWGHEGAVRRLAAERDEARNEAAEWKIRAALAREAEREWKIRVELAREAEQERDVYLATLNRVSAALGLPPNVGPAPGELKRIRR